jgi:2-C-methyl-D-erythritol 4-phosphate cytidylyltransferase
MNTAIIVAAGSGERFKSEIPKQFLEINGKPVIVHTIERFQAAPSVDSIVLVLANDRIVEFGSLQKDPSKLSKIVAGGTNRAESVLNGLKAVAEDCEVVAVHDGARPLVSVEEIERTIAKAKETGAACLVAPVTDTIKSISGDAIAATLDRAKLRRALTPQAFRKDILRRAFELADLNGSVTDECYLVEKLGHPISLVEGSSRNIKITNPEDLILAEALIRN